MARTIIELALLTRELSKDSDGRVRTSRVFQVHGVLPAQIPTNSVFMDDFGATLPREGDAHPDGHGVCDQTSRQPLAGDSTLYTAYYSTDGAFKYLAAPAPQDAAFPSVLYHWEEVVVDIPIQVRKTATVAGSTATVTYWDIETVPITETRLVLEVSTYVPTWGWSESLYVLGQVNKLHLFRGRQWRFRTPSLSRSGTGYTVSYAWELDQGTPKGTDAGQADIKTPSDSGVLIVPPVLSGLIRNPWTTLKVVPDADTTVLGRWQMVYHYTPDDDGHEGLPGIGSLL